MKKSRKLTLRLGPNDLQSVESLELEVTITHSNIKILAKDSKGKQVKFSSSIQTLKDHGNNSSR